MKKKYAIACAAVMCATFSLCADSASAALVVVSSGFNGRYTSIGEPAGPQDLILFGANAVPNGLNGTTGMYSQFDSVSMTTVSGQLRFPNFTLNPNVFDGAVPYSTGLTGPWDFTFTNGPDITTGFQTPALGTASALPFVQSVSVSGNGASPTLNWQVPSDPNITRQQVWVWQQRPNGAADLIHVSNNIPLPQTPLTQNSYQIPALQTGQLYSFSVVLYDDSPRPEVSRSFTYVGYSVLNNANIQSPIFLPVQSTGPGGGTVFSFQPITVGAGKEIFIDPLVAVGYDYAVGAGNPNFQSVELPDLPGMVQLEIDYNGLSFQVDDGTSFEFPNGGVAEFRVTGIPLDLGLNPSDPTAFVTGLTFAGEGVFTGTMTPIAVAVPEPSTLALTSACLLLLIRVARRTRRK